MYLNKIQLALSPQTYLNKLSLLDLNNDKPSKMFSWFDANFTWSGGSKPEPNTNNSTWFDANFTWS